MVLKYRNYYFTMPLYMTCPLEICHVNNGKFNCVLINLKWSLIVTENK